MSGRAPESPAGPPELSTLDELERVVEDVLRELRVMASRLDRAERENAELRALVSRVTNDPEEAPRVLERLGILERENADLAKRLETARAGVERLLARVQFMEDQR